MFCCTDVMSIKIVTDSTCDLPSSVIEQYGIAVVPLYINVGKEGYLDGVDLSREAFYAQLPTYETHPTTPAAGSELFQQHYERAAEEGATEVLSIHIASSLSATLDVARLAAKQTTSVPVTVFDSKQLSLGTGFLVEQAAKAAAEGRSMGEIVTLLEEQISRTHVFAVLDTLEYLKRSGRMNGVMASFATWLKIKPILKMYQGDATSERVRTSKKAIKRLMTLLSDAAPLEKVALLHTNAPQKAAALRKQVQHLLPEEDIMSVNITPVIGAHIGPGAVGFACVSR